MFLKNFDFLQIYIIMGVGRKTYKPNGLGKEREHHEETF